MDFEDYGGYEYYTDEQYCQDLEIYQDQPLIEECIPDPQVKSTLTEYDFFSKICDKVNNISSTTGFHRDIVFQCFINNNFDLDKTLSSLQTSFSHFALSSNIHEWYNNSLALNIDNDDNNHNKHIDNSNPDIHVQNQHGPRLSVTKHEYRQSNSSLTTHLLSDHNSSSSDLGQQQKHQHSTLDTATTPTPHTLSQNTKHQTQIELIQSSPLVGPQTSLPLSSNIDHNTTYIPFALPTPMISLAPDHIFAERYTQYTRLLLSHSHPVLGHIQSILLEQGMMSVSPDSTLIHSPSPSQGSSSSSQHCINSDVVYTCSVCYNDIPTHYTPIQSSSSLASSLSTFQPETISPETPPFIFAPCGHGYCLECWSSHLDVQLTSRDLSPVCMAPGCKTPLGLTFIQYIIWLNMILYCVSFLSSSSSSSSLSLDSHLDGIPESHHNNNTSGLLSFSLSSLLPSSDHSKSIIQHIKYIIKILSPLEQLLSLSSILDPNILQINQYYLKPTNHLPSLSSNNTNNNSVSKQSLSYSTPNTSQTVLDSHTSPTLSQQQQQQQTSLSLSSQQQLPVVIDQLLPSLLLPLLQPLYITLIDRIISSNNTIYIRCTLPCTMIHDTTQNSITNISTCQQCHIVSLCTLCLKHQHVPLSCLMVVVQESLLTQQETSNHLWMLQNCRSCPQCHCSIEKNSGCSHMTCYQCQYEFCWVCLGSWKQHLEDNKSRPALAYKCTSNNNTLQVNVSLIKNKEPIEMSGTRSTLSLQSQQKLKNKNKNNTGDNDHGDSKNDSDDDNNSNERDNNNNGSNSDDEKNQQNTSKKSTKGQSNNSRQDQAALFQVLNCQWSSKFHIKQARMIVSSYQKQLERNTSRTNKGVSSSSLSITSGNALLQNIGDIQLYTSSQQPSSLHTHHEVQSTNILSPPDNTLLSKLQDNLSDDPIYQANILLSHAYKLLEGYWVSQYLHSAKVAYMTFLERYLAQQQQQAGNTSNKKQSVPYDHVARELIRRATILGTSIKAGLSGISIPATDNTTKSQNRSSPAPPPLGPLTIPDFDPITSFQYQSLTEHAQTLAALVDAVSGNNNTKNQHYNHINNTNDTVINNLYTLLLQQHTALVAKIKLVEVTRPFD